jgi:hypothetical protein
VYRRVERRRGMLKINQDPQAPKPEEAEYKK